MILLANYVFCEIRDIASGDHDTPNRFYSCPISIPTDPMHDAKSCYIYTTINCCMKQHDMLMPALGIDVSYSIP